MKMSEELVVLLREKGPGVYKDEYEAAVRRLELRNEDPENVHVVARDDVTCAMPNEIIWEDGSTATPREAEEWAWEILALCDAARIMGADHGVEA